jgi:hypothetical protein
MLDFHASCAPCSAIPAWLKSKSEVQTLSSIPRHHGQRVSPVPRRCSQLWRRLKLVEWTFLPLAPPALWNGRASSWLFHRVKGGQGAALEAGALELDAWLLRFIYTEESKASPASWLKSEVQISRSIPRHHGQNLSPAGGGWGVDFTILHRLRFC